MRRSFTLLAILWLMLATTTWAQTATAPSSGDGTGSNPYEIANLGNLYWLSQNNTEWSKHFIQTVDINAADSKNWDISGSDTLGFSPIGNRTTKFTGSYNGRSHIIDSLIINRSSTSYMGLFGYTSSAIIDSLGISSCNINAGYHSGGLVGTASDSSIIRNCYTTGTVSGKNYIGGLVGNNVSSFINNCYSSVSVSGGQGIGGLLGKNSTSATVSNCYSTGVVSGSDSYVGGLVGYNSSSTINSSYSTGVVSGESTVAGVVGYNDSSSSINDCYYNSETSGQTGTEKGTPLSIAEMKQSSNFGNWDFADVWEITNGVSFPRLKNVTDGPIILHLISKAITINVEYNNTIQVVGMDNQTVDTKLVEYPVGMTIDNNGMIVWTPSELGEYAVKLVAADANGMISTYSFTISVISIIGEGTESNPYELDSLNDLKELSETPSIWDSYFIQTADIDASETTAWNDSLGFSPIGNEVIKFRGDYDGQGHIINGLTINRPSTYYIGLFGYTYEASIESLALTSCVISGNYYVGALVGRVSSSIVSDCYTTGSVTGSGSSVGGLVGYNTSTSTLTNTYSACVVSGISSVGGLVGQNYSSSTIYNSYSVGAVSSERYAGGLVGYSYNATISTSYYNSETSGQNDTGKGDALTTTQMKQSSNFSTWNFSNNWDITNGVSFPRLKSVANGPIILHLLSKTNKTNEVYNDTIQVVGMDNQYINIELLQYPEGMTLETGVNILWTPLTTGSSVVKIAATDSNGLVNTYSYSINVLSIDGEGTEDNPYEISSLEALKELSETPFIWGSYFIQTADIDASETNTWNDGEGFSPIGNETTKFSGSYNGQGHAINGLIINRPSERYIGVFGYTYGATIDSLALTSCVISGTREVGALVGYNNSSSTISNCYATGSVSGSSSYVGGLVGYHYSSSTISNCYTTTVVSGTSHVGGLVGSNGYKSKINNSFSTGSVSGEDNLGGLVGDDGYSSTVSDSYYNSETSGQNDTGKGDALTTTQMKQSSSFSNWDFTNTWEITNGETFPRLQDMADVPIILQNLSNIYKLNAVNKDIIQVVDMDNQTVSIELLQYPEGMTLVSDSIITWTPTAVGNDTVEIAAIDANGLINTYSYSIDVISMNGEGTEDDPYEIATLEALKELSETPSIWSSYFIQTADIYASETNTWNDGEGFSPIGNKTTKFMGSYNGQGHIIIGLSINRPSADYIGLFGYTFNASIESLGIASCSISGEYFVGAFVGYNYTTTVSNSYATGTVLGSRYVGGFAGEISYLSSVSNSYATGSVYGEYAVGGFAGDIYYSTVSSSYATGVVSGTTGIGSFIGQSYSDTISNCYYNSEANGLTDTINGTPLTTAQMKQSSSFIGWDFTNTWGIIADRTYPALLGLNNNAPFAFADTLNVAGSSSLLSNDYDYETGQNALTAKLISASTKGSISNGAYNFNANTTTGTIDTVTYCVGELIANSDTLWGNYAVAILTKIANTAPILSAVASDLTTDENTSLTLSLDDVTASDAEGDALSVVISAGDNYTVDGNTITPIADFIGTLTVPVAVSDGELESNTMDMTITVEQKVSNGVSDMNISGITVYPNPATTSIFVEGSKSIASIYNLVGVKVLTHDLSQSNSINISHLANGIYVLSLDGKGIKVVKE